MVAPEFRSETRKAIDVVAHALTLIDRHALAGDITFKGDRDLVTTTDVAVEDTIRGLLIDAFGLPVVGEERGGEVPADRSAYWLVDPICGTRNFASGIPLYCINLALVEGDEIVVAVIGDVSSSDVQVAERGRGAWAVTHGLRRSLATSDESRIIVIEDGKSKGTRREHAAQFAAAAIRADHWDFRSLGTTLALPYLATGRISAYVVFFVAAIHAAAGTLVATEAGATVTDIEGRPWRLHSDSLLVGSNDDLHADLLELANDTAPRPK